MYTKFYDKLQAEYVGASEDISWPMEKYARNVQLAHVIMPAFISPMGMVKKSYTKEREWAP